MARSMKSTEEIKCIRAGREGCRLMSGISQFSLKTDLAACCLDLRKDAGGRCSE